MLIVISGILGGARMVYTYTGGLYFARYVLHNDSWYSLITLLVVPGGLVASLLVPWMTKKFTKSGHTSMYISLVRSSCLPCTSSAMMRLGN